MAVTVGCTMLPLGVFVIWLLLHEGPSPRQLTNGITLTVILTLAGVVAALFLLYHLLTPLRLMAEVVQAYQEDHQLPQLPDDGRDEVGVLMRGINCGLREIDEGIRELERHVLDDPLTHALSRRGSDQHLHACVERAERGQPLVLYVLDVDNLKPVNDEHGHAAGDRMLIDLVASAKRLLRGDDWIGRWGGDEFLICIHDTQPAANERMRSLLAELSVPRADGIPISVSVGCAQYRPGGDAAQLYREADAAMYSAKAQGGSTLVCDDGHSTLAEPLH